MPGLHAYTCAAARVTRKAPPRGCNHGFILRKCKKPREVAGLFVSLRPASGSELAKHVVQDAAVLHVLDFLRRVETHAGGELQLRAVLAGRDDLHGPGAAVVQAGDRKSTR